MKQLDRIKRKSIKSLYDGGTPSLRGTIIKIVALGLVDALALFTAFLLLPKQQYLGMAGVLLTALIVSFLYLRRGGLPAKPGRNQHQRHEQGGQKCHRPFAQHKPRGLAGDQPCRRE